jgi:hypothetical protein
MVKDYGFLELVHPSVARVSDLWRDIDDLINGHERLNEISRKYIRPRLGETTEQYLDRLRRVTFSPVLADTIRDLIKKLKTGTVKVNAPSLGDWVQDFNWVNFAGDIATDILTYGRVLILVTDGGLKVLNPRQCTNYGEVDDSRWFLLKETVVESISPFMPAETVIKHLLIDGSQVTTYENRKGIVTEETVNHGYSDTPIFYVIAPPELFTAGAALPKAAQHFVIENTIYEGASNLYVQRTMTKQLFPDNDIDDTYSIDSGNEHIMLGDFNFSEASGSSIRTGIELLESIKSEIKGIISTGSMANSSKLSVSGEARKFDYLDYSLTVSSLGSFVLSTINEALNWFSTATGVGGDFEATGLDIFQVDNLEYLLDVADRILPHTDKIDGSALESWYSKIDSTLSR